MKMLTLDKTIARIAALGLLLVFVASYANGQEGTTKPQVRVDLPVFFGPKKRAVVAPLEVKVNAVATTVTTPSGNTSVVSLDLAQPTDFGTGLTEMLITAMVECNRFIVLDRQALEDIARERSLPDADPNTTAKAGNLLGAQVLVKGAITELSFKRSGAGANLVSEVIDGSVANSVATVAIDLRIIDVTTGEVLESVRAEGRVGSKAMTLNLKKEDLKFGVASFDNGPLGFAVRRAVEQAVKKIATRAEKIRWQGRVVQVVDEDGKQKVYLNFGSNSGLKVGDVLHVSRAGIVLVDPETNLVLGRTDGKRVGRIRIESLQEKFAIATPVEGEGFEREDVVHLVPTPQ
jgi:curli biogenesis system outer membrane secretion channel CsgG